MEFADPEVYARAMAATGPAYEAIQNVGEAEFHRAAVEQAQGQLRDGLPLRAEINVVGYLARKPDMSNSDNQGGGHAGEVSRHGGLHRA